MTNLISNVVKVIAVPVGKKFETIAIMKDGTRASLKAMGNYKPVVNFFNETINMNARNGLGLYASFNNKVVTSNPWLQGRKCYVKSFDVELVA
jgi:hypothetical protein